MMMDVAHFWAIFQTIISVHFRNLFVSHIALPVKIDIKKPCQQHTQVRCPRKYESSRWKYLLHLIRRLRIGHIADFLKCTSGFHATMLTFPIEMWQNFIWRYIALGVLDNVSKAHCRISYSFGDTEAKVDWGGGILPQLPEQGLNPGRQNRMM